jgi:hypothetical protein
MLGQGCKRSQVWLGHAAHSTVEPAADSGVGQSAAAERDAGTMTTAADAGTLRDAGGLRNSTPAPAGSSAPAADGGGSAGMTAARDPLEPTFLPTPSAACPELVSGEARLLDSSLRLWVGPERPAPGPLVIYWHGVGSSTSEASDRLSFVLDEIMEQGGMMVALAETTSRGSDTGTGAWHTGDFEIVDELVACALASGRIDKRRIYASGCSAGGLAAGTMAYMRSGYLAGVQLDSGGTILDEALQDPEHVPALIAAHGASDTDIVIVNFAELSVELAMRIASSGGFAVRCDHGGGHCGTPSAIREAQWQFLLAHPYGTKPSPYEAGLPSSFPRQCQIIRAR